MIVSCPKCATEYRIDANVVGVGRQLRCAVCHFEWRHVASGGVREVNVDLSRGAAPLRSGRVETRGDVEPAAIADGPGPLPALAFLTAAMLTLLAAAAYHLDARLLGGDEGPPAWLTTYRAGVDAAFAYAPALRTPDDATAAGVVFAEAGYDLVDRPDGHALEIWGRIANNGAEPALAPSVEIVSRDADGERLQRWVAWSEADVLQPGESARFSSRMMHPLGPIAHVDFYFE